MIKDTDPFKNQNNSIETDEMAVPNGRMIDPVPDEAVIHIDNMEAFSKAMTEVLERGSDPADALSHGLPTPDTGIYKAIDQEGNVHYIDTRADDYGVRLSNVAEISELSGDTVPRAQQLEENADGQETDPAAISLEEMKDDAHRQFNSTASLVHKMVEELEAIQINDNDQRAQAQTVDLLDYKLQQAYRMLGEGTSLDLNTDHDLQSAIYTLETIQQRSASNGSEGAAALSEGQIREQIHTMHDASTDIDNLAARYHAGSGDTTSNEFNQYTHILAEGRNLQLSVANLIEAIPHDTETAVNSDRDIDTGLAETIASLRRHQGITAENIDTLRDNIHNLHYLFQDSRRVHSSLEDIHDQLVVWGKSLSRLADDMI
ncbi:MAG TPA: hypothetical protein VGE13_03040 [Candidatus Saccharimonadales bacterium]